MSRMHTLRFDASLTFVALAAAALISPAFGAGCGGSDDGAFPPGVTQGKGGTAGASADGGGTGGTNAGGSGGGIVPDGSASGGSAGAAGGNAGSGGGSGKCTDDNQCAATPATPYCSASGLCVGCEAGDPAHVCATGMYCCGSVCKDVNSDPANCGGCGAVCSLPQAQSGCVSGACVIVSCKSGYADCDGLALDGCEAMTGADGGGCSCSAGMVEPCYDGAAGTSGVGPCTSGTHTCDANGIAWGPCEGQVTPEPDSCYDDIDNDCNGVVNDGVSTGVPGCGCLPGATLPCYEGLPGTEGVGICHGGTMTCVSTGVGYDLCTGQETGTAEVCANGLDDNCNGAVDDISDTDGDGWTKCNGDCCELTNCASDPKLVNPGAIEVAGDGVDNDCDGTVDNVLPTNCSTAAKFTGVTGNDLAMAMDLCQFTTEVPALPQKKWGVIAASQLLADGSGGTPTQFQNQQSAVSTLFGNSVSPKKNATLGIISSGMARDANDPGWVSPVSGTALTSVINFPGGPPLSTYVNAHGGGLLPGHCGSTTCPVGSGAYDSINIRFRIRVPTNAKGMSYDFRFYSAEYQTYQCTAYNDYFLAMLTTSAAGIPGDHNISFDALNNPVSVNNGFFQDCGGNGMGCGSCPNGTASLAGTGFDQVSGGSTQWLTTDAPVVGGETITIEFLVFDVSDHILDTLVLLDNFRWSLTPVTVGTHE